MTKKSFWIIVYLFAFCSLSWGQPKSINVGVVNKKALSLPKPTFTNHFRINQEQLCVVQIVIDMEGKVISAKAIYGHGLLRGACENAARQAKFSPILTTIPPIKIAALLVYKFKPDKTIETDIEKDDEAVLGKTINFVEPIPPFCNCRFGSSPNVLVQAEIDGQGNVTKATAISGHALLKIVSEHASRFAKFLPINLKTKLIISYNFTKVNKWSVKYSSFEIKTVRILK
jgi:hypothetical protein